MTQSPQNNPKHLALELIHKNELLAEVKQRLQAIVTQPNLKSALKKELAWLEEQLTEANYWQNFQTYFT